MNISEEMKKRAKEVDNLPFEEKTTGAYDLTSFVPKVEALEIENENFDNENKLLKQQNKELIKIGNDMYWFLKGANIGYLKIEISNGRNINDLIKKWEDIINES